MRDRGSFGDLLPIYPGKVHIVTRFCTIFLDEIIGEQLSLPNGPTESLAYAYHTKVITLEKTAA